MHLIQSALRTYQTYFEALLATRKRVFSAGDWGKKVEAGSICDDIVDRSQNRSLEQLMDQDSINIDNGENQANKRARGILLE